MTNKPKTCANCGGANLKWWPSLRIKTGVQQNRLNTSDVECLFVLGCEECSETVSLRTADQVAADMNGGQVTVPTPAQVMTPVPTEDMLNAGVKFALHAQISHGYVWTDYVRDMYKTMQAVAPARLRKFTVIAVFAKSESPSLTTYGEIRAIVEAASSGAAIHDATQSFVAAGFAVEFAEAREL